MHLTSTLTNTPHTTHTLLAKSPYCNVVSTWEYYHFKYTPPTQHPSHIQHVINLIPLFLSPLFGPPFPDTHTGVWKRGNGKGEPKKGDSIAQMYMAMHWMDTHPQKHTPTPHTTHLTKSPYFKASWSGQCRLAIKNKRF